MLLLAGCGALRSPPALPTTTEAACNCPSPPAALLKPTPAPAACLDIATNGRLWACAEGCIGTPDDPQSGALNQCNADKARIEKFHDGQKARQNDTR